MVGESEGGEGHAAAVGDAFVHRKEIRGDEEVGVGESGVHAGDHLGDVGFGADVDMDDLSFVALALELDCPLWTRDLRLKRHLIKNGFSSFFDPAASI